MTFLPDPGLHFVVGLSGQSLTEEEALLLAKLRPAGIILFKHNIAEDSNWPAILEELINSAASAVARPALLVSIDHEGGRVDRLYPPVTHFPPANIWGDRSAEVGAAMARELAALGINLAFAPCTDVLLNRENTVIGNRSLGSDPLRVAQLAEEFLSALEANGVNGCIKHFPGHGGTSADSHFELPVDDSDIDTLQNEHLVPFRALINDGAGLVMTSHVIYPALDNENPASLSQRIITGLLREELGFNGLVATDALEMRALQHISLEDKAIQAISAGTDLLLVCQPYGRSTLEQMEVMLAALSQKERSSVEFATTLSDSQLRIRLYLSELALRSATAEIDRSYLGCKEHAALAAAITNDNRS